MVLIILIALFCAVSPAIMTFHKISLKNLSWAQTRNTHHLFGYKER